MNDMMNGMTREEAANLIENEKACVITADNGDCIGECNKCDLVRDSGDIIEAYNMALRSLEAWDEVKEELKMQSARAKKNGAMDYGIGFEDAEYIVDKHLQQIEKGATT